jgi:AraC-like DNA-binding protein
VQHIRIATDHLPARKQFSFYREELFERLVGLTVERPGEAGFRARVTASIDPAIQRFQAHSQSYHAARTHADINRVDWHGWMAIFLEKGDSTQLVHRRGEVATRIGDIALLDPSIPLSMASLGDHRHEVWFIPRTSLAAHLPPKANLEFQILNRRSGLTQIVRDYLKSIERQMDTLARAELDAVIDNLCRLLVISTGGDVGGDAEAMRAGALAALKRHIDRNLRNPALTPDSASAALKMNIRYRHRLLEPTGETFADYVMRRRLEECRASLLHPFGTEQPIIDLAMSWGFNSMPTFYRNFSRRFILSPRQLQIAAATHNAENR